MWVLVFKRTYNPNYCIFYKLLINLLGKVLKNFKPPITFQFTFLNSWRFPCTGFKVVEAHAIPSVIKILKVLIRFKLTYIPSSSFPIHHIVPKLIERQPKKKKTSYVCTKKSHKIYDV